MRRGSTGKADASVQFYSAAGRCQSRALPTVAPRYGAIEPCLASERLGAGGGLPAPVFPGSGRQAAAGTRNVASANRQVYSQHIRCALSHFNKEAPKPRSFVMSRRDHELDPVPAPLLPGLHPQGQNRHHPATVPRRDRLGRRGVDRAVLVDARGRRDRLPTPPRRGGRWGSSRSSSTAPTSRRPQTSWRSWGGIEKQEQADAEVVRIQGELEKLKASADFPVTILPIAAVRSARDVEALKDTAEADVLLIYAAGADMDCFAAAAKTGKDMIFFVRHRSGPVYLWYEIISPRYLRQHGDSPGRQRRRLRRRRGRQPGRDPVASAFALRPAQHDGQQDPGHRRAGGWAQPGTVVPDLVKKLWKLDIQTITYDELGKLIAAARGDSAAVAKAKRRAADYLKLPGTTLETEMKFVDNAFLLEQVFRGLMKQAGCRAITINSCMGTIMPMAETTACLPLSMLNDDGYLAFCESDFVVIPSGMLLGEISGQPMFLNDPTYPHDGVITLAHCTARARWTARRSSRRGS